MNYQYMAILIHLGKEIAMQFLDAEDYKTACTEADNTVDILSGKWVNIVRINNQQPVDLNQAIGK